MLDVYNVPESVHGDSDTMKCHYRCRKRFDNLFVLLHGSMSAGRHIFNYLYFRCLAKFSKHALLGIGDNVAIDYKIWCQVRYQLINLMTCSKQ